MNLISALYDWMRLAHFDEDRIDTSTDVLLTKTVIPCRVLVTKCNHVTHLLFLVALVVASDFLPQNFKKWEGLRNGTSMKTGVGV